MIFLLFIIEVIRNDYSCLLLILAYGRKEGPVS